MLSKRETLAAQLCGRNADPRTEFSRSIIGAWSLGRPRMTGSISVTGVKQGAAQSCWGPRSVAPGVAGGLGFWSCMHVNVGWSPTFMDTPPPRCDNTQLLQGVRRMMGVKAQQKPTAFLPQSWGARGPQSRG